MLTPRVAATHQRSCEFAVLTRLELPGGGYRDRIVSIVSRGEADTPCIHCLQTPPRLYLPPMIRPNIPQTRTSKRSLCSTRDSRATAKNGYDGSGRTEAQAINRTFQNATKTRNGSNRRTTASMRYTRLFTTRYDAPGATSPTDSLNTFDPDEPISSTLSRTVVATAASPARQKKHPAARPASPGARLKAQCCKASTWHHR